MVKEIKAIIKLQIPAGKATPAPPVGPTLAQYGIDIASFCRKFNEATKEKAGFTIPVEIRVFKDRSFDFTLKKPPTSDFLKRAAGIEKGSGEPKRAKVGKITREQLRKIAKKKMNDLNTKDIKKAMKIIKGTAENMGIEIE